MARLTNNGCNTTVGLLLARPTIAPVGYRHYATDDNGGTEYLSDGANWVLVGPKIELASVFYTAVDDVSRSSAGGQGGFHALYGPTDATTPTPVNTPAQASWVSRGRPVIVEAHAYTVKDATAAYLWTYIHLLGGSNSGVNTQDAIDNVAASARLTQRPWARFADAAGVSRTVGVGLAIGSGSATLKGTQTRLAIRAYEV